MKNKWMEELHAFFDCRSKEMERQDITLEALCYVSGRDPRLWKDEDLYKDMVESITQQLGLKKEHSLLEVGCATGFLALGLSKIVGQYTGVDLSKKAIELASSLNIKNSSFKKANGENLPFSDNNLDRSICYDVVTNFPQFSFIKPIIHEMIRVIKPMGKAMIGSVPDEEKKDEFQKIVQKVGAHLEKSFGPLSNPIEKSGFPMNVRKWYLKKIKKVIPQIVCYYFRQDDFISLGKELGIKVEIFDIHKGNPYHGYRYNVVYTKN
jgi:ubiquinone/menaquinone biosynthesis C-methylase UbiE